MPHWTDHLTFTFDLQAGSLVEAPAEAMQQASLAVAASTHLGPQPDGTALAVPELQGASQKQLAAAFSTAVAWACAGEAECSGLHALHVWTLADGLQARAELHSAGGVGYLPGLPHGALDLFCGLLQWWTAAFSTPVARA